VLVVLGLGFARFGDDCARGGVHGAAALDDVGRAAVGSRMASWGPTKAAELGVDDAARLGLSADDAARLGVKADRTALPGLRGAAVHVELAGVRAGEGEWFEALGDLGVDVVTEIASADFDGEPLPTVIAEPGQVRCPHRLEITREPAAWDELLGGVGVACAPVVVVGTASADGKGLRVGEQDVALLELAKACADVEARCVLVGCPAVKAEACVAETEESFVDNQLQSSLPAYVRGLVERALTQEVAPVVIAELAAVEGAAKLVIVRPDTGEQ